MSELTIMGGHVWLNRTDLHWPSLDDCEAWMIRLHAEVVAARRAEAAGEGIKTSAPPVVAGLGTAGSLAGLQVDEQRLAGVGAAGQDTPGDGGFLDGRCPYLRCHLPAHPEHPDGHVIYGSTAPDRHDRLEAEIGSG